MTGVQTCALRSHQQQLPLPPAHRDPSARKVVEAVCPDVVVDETHRSGSGAFPRRYRRGRFLGKGGFAVVYELQDELTGEVVAGKVRGG